MNIRKTTASAMILLSLSACADQGGFGTSSRTGGFGGMSSETIGTIGGAAGGALIGSQFGSGTGQLAATAIGTLAGALAGREIARYMSRNDQNYASTAESSAVTRNQPITWNNPETGNRGVIQPTRTYQSDAGQTCREYTHTVYIGGQAETARGTACMQPDGTWRMVS